MIKDIDVKLKDNKSTSRDLTKINRIDEFITIGMIQREKGTKKSKLTHPCSPILEIALLTVTLWKSKFTAVINNKGNHHTVLKTFNKIIDINDNNTFINIESNIRNIFRMN